VLTDAELETLVALESLASDDADYVAVARDKLIVLCRVLRVSGLHSSQIASAHAADKADRLERTVDEFARHNEALRQRGESMQERYRSLRQEILELRSWLDGLDSIEEARQSGVRHAESSPSMNAWRNGFETCQEAVLERMAGVPLVALTDTPVDRFVDLNGLQRRIAALEGDLAHERDTRTWLMERMNALGLALGLRSHLASPDKLLRQALRLDAIALAAEQLMARLREGAGSSSEEMARALGLVEAQTELDALEHELDRWRHDPDTMKAETGDGDDDDDE
jgi:phage shock protein A